MAHFTFLVWIPSLLITKFSLKTCEIFFFLNYCAKKWIFYLCDVKHGNINFQEKQPAKYKNLSTVSFKIISIISQGKEFCRQRIPPSSCARKETADRDIIKKSKNGDRKIMQPIDHRNSSTSSYEYLPN